MNIEHYKRYCKDYENIENYDKALKDNFKGWHCHHRLETHNSDGERRLVDISYKELKALGMYYNRPAEELIFLTRSEHRASHKVSSETRNKISEAKKGNKYALGYKHSEEAKKKISDAQKGKKLSEETKKKMSEAKKNMSEETRKKMSEVRKGNKPALGMHWYNNGKENKFCFECPDGFTPGRLRTNKSLLEYLDRTGQHVSRKTFEKYKDEKKSFIAWEVLFNIYETHGCAEKTN